ncbi:glycosyltransferase [Pseudonocardia spirodelae]|uniref:Glycosyltransferase n=1 Tax=Pseudonocardia spirodelae TaxID=3133431 RepID=A0ABU8T2T2_9PSEU
MSSPTRAPISVVVPAYNSARTIAETLRSVLAQDVDMEVLVLDNASTDGTGDIVRSVGDPRVVVHRNEALLPLGDNWNRAVRLSRGELVKLVCADDLLGPGTVAEQADVLADPGVALVASRHEVIDESGRVLGRDLGLGGLLGRVPSRRLVATLVRRGPIDFAPTAATMWRRTGFDRAGGFRGRYVFCMDVDLFARIMRYGEFVGTPGHGASWRESRFNVSRTRSSLSKLSEMRSSNYQLRRDLPGLVGRSDLLAGDVRLVRAGLERVRVRSLATVRARPEVV